MMSLPGIFSSLEQVQLLVFVAALAMARALGLMLLMALFTRIRMTGLLRNGVALAFSIPLFPPLIEIVRTTDMTAAMVVTLAFKELLIGAALGFAMSIPFLAAEAAGDIVDLQRGVTMGSLIDPMITRETSATGTLFGIIIATIFLSLGGLATTLDILYKSYQIWPAEQFSPIFSRDSVEIFLDLMTAILVMAISIAFPLIAGLLLSDILLAFISRAAPHLNVFALSLIAKSLVYSLLLVLYATFLLTYLKGELSFFNEVSRFLEDASCRAC